MFRVFIVDDEIAAREAIRGAVPWAELGFEPVGETADGELALSMLREARPDVLITDIRMPYMDGMELCRRVRRELPDARIVIVSACRDFDCAREAVSLGVREYLSKPVDAAALREALARVANDLREERLRREREEELRRHLTTSDRFYRERMLDELYAGGNAEAVLRSARAMRMNLTAKRYRVIMLRPKAEIDERGRAELYAAMDRLTARSGGTAYWRRGGVSLSLLVLGDGPEDLRGRAEALTEAACEAARAAGIELAAAQGKDVERLADVPASLSDAGARMALLLRGAGKPGLNGESVYMPSLDLSPLAEQLRHAAPADAGEIVARRAEALGVERSGALATYLCVDVLLTVGRIVRDCGGALPDTVPVGILDRGTDALLALCRDAVARALEFRDSHSPTRRGGAVRKACAYIDEHFADPNLALRDVAASVALSNNHFCTVFSREMGVTFSAYLTALRMRRAAELLRDTDQRTGEVAYAVGYNDPHYFSQLFKKNTGTSPRDYRRECRSARLETGK